MPRPLIDPRLRPMMDEMYPSRCTIRQVTYTVTSANQRIASGATDVPGMVNLPCRLAPIIFVRPTADEIRDSKIQESYDRTQIKINRYLPSIEQRDMYALVDGVIWPIRGVEADSSDFSTRLKLERIRPNG